MYRRTVNFKADLYFLFMKPKILISFLSLYFNLFSKIHGFMGFYYYNNLNMNYNPVKNFQSIHQLLADQCH